MAHDRSTDSLWSDSTAGAGGARAGAASGRLSHFKQSAALTQSHTAAFALGGEAGVGSRHGPELSSGGRRALALAAGAGERVVDLEVRAVSWSAAYASNSRGSGGLIERNRARQKWWSLRLIPPISKANSTDQDVIGQGRTFRFTWAYTTAGESGGIKSGVPLRCA